MTSSTLYSLTALILPPSEGEETRWSPTEAYRAKTFSTGISRIILNVKRRIINIVVCTCETVRRRDDVPANKITLLKNLDKKDFF